MPRNCLGLRAICCYSWTNCLVGQVPAAIEPTPVVEEATLPRARSVKSIGASMNGGQVEVNIAADGELKYKAFRLENPMYS